MRETACSLYQIRNEYINMTWFTSTDEKTNVLLPLAHHDFTEGLLDISLFQVNYITNFLGCLLHLCFVTNPDCVFLSKVGPHTQPEDPYNPAFEVSIDTGAVRRKIREVN